MTIKGLWVAVLAGFFLPLGGCGTASVPEPVSTLEIAPPQNPYQAKTSTPGLPTPTVTIPSVMPILPTATPLVHSIQPGDTLFGLALQYDISVDELVMANPGVDTSILSIGMELNIPQSTEEELTVPTPTPYPTSLQAPVCYSTSSVGMWCFSMLTNDHNLVLENLSVAFQIFDQSQQLFQTYPAITPLDYLFPDQSLPAVIFIAGDIPDPYQVSAALLTSLPSDLEEPLSQVVGQQYLYSQDNRIADISGTVEITDQKVEVEEIWVVAIGFNQGTPVGLRKWISPPDLDVDQETPFEMVLYSLGPPIDSIQLFSELH